MARRCELTGKSVQVGHRVSHANNKSKHRFLPNLCTVNLLSDALGQGYSFRVSANALIRAVGPLLGGKGGGNASGGLMEGVESGGTGLRDPRELAGGDG